MPIAKKAPKKYQPKGLTILFEDRDVILVDKPCGLLSIGTGRDNVRTVHSILVDYVRKGDPRSRHRVYIVHRLDRETSGILILAKSEEAKAYLQSHWSENEKRYLAVVHGTLAEKSGAIGSYLAENSALNVYSTNDASLGKWAETRYTVLKEFRGMSLLDIQILTGRKHQIRVHLSGLGHPLVGDKKYGRPHDPQPTLLLHARSLTFTHPVNGRRLNFAAPVPETFVRLAGDFTLSAG